MLSVPSTAVSASKRASVVPNSLARIPSAAKSPTDFAASAVDCVLLDKTCSFATTCVPAVDEAAELHALFKGVRGRGV